MKMMPSHIQRDNPPPLLSRGFLRLLAGLGGCLLAGAVLGWPGDARSEPAANLPSLRQKLVPANVQQCRSLLQRKPQLDPYAPKSSAAWEGYCSCVGQGYVANMPDNVVLAFASGKLPQDPNQQAARMRAAAASLDAARARCAGAR
ncbi:hypothetical protein [Bordetella bronchialis]|uniref:Rap1a immunity protein domain-containing protein n=1 Tax=Bordetella bronchialis TaxID=463025 RepID=A0ABM6CWH0_9BORD|nr:hypothetical protein [Bordetella bronchialis]ANN68464.1 hypothetical protein BAU06_21095 [Bordetella bronchialis]